MTRLTPHFHNITIENLTAVGSKNAGAIVGLPEAPVLGVVLRNVKIEAEHGLNIGYASVSGTGVTVTAKDGARILPQTGAKISIR